MRFAVWSLVGRRPVGSTASAETVRALEMAELDAIAREGGDHVEETVTAIAGEAMRVVRVGLLAKRTRDTDRVGDKFVSAPRPCLTAADVGAGVVEHTPQASPGSCRTSVVTSSPPPTVVGRKLNDILENRVRRLMDEHSVGRHCNHDVVLEEIRNQLACVRLSEVVHTNPATVAIVGELVLFEALSVAARVVVSIRWRHRWNSRRVVCAPQRSPSAPINYHVTEHSRSSTQRLNQQYVQTSGSCWLTLGLVSITVPS